MARQVSIGAQNFAEIREGGFFYIDKTAFIQEWWQRGIPATLITRPRRFGKTLMMSTVEHFFSTKYEGRSDLFEDLDVWKSEKLRGLQGTYPVIFLSFSSVKGEDFATQRALIVDEILPLYSAFEKDGPLPGLNSTDQDMFARIRYNMDDATLIGSLKFLCHLNYLRYGKKTIILLDEYDTPIHESYVQGYWEKMVALLRGLFNKTFKGNEYMGRCILTGITRVSKESMFSDMNNLRVYSLSVPTYSTYFGFTEKEVLTAMAEYGLTDYDGVKSMYDGYIIGETKGIYNPWSISSYLEDPRLIPWWSNTSGNAMVAKLISDGGPDLQNDFLVLLEGGSIQTELNEQIVYDQLKGAIAVYSLLLAAGYMKIEGVEHTKNDKEIYSLSLVNGEVRKTMAGLVRSWFSIVSYEYNHFIKALLTGNLNDMNEYMNKIALNCFSSFDTGGTTEGSEPERFYHGFVLGLLVELRDRFVLTSNKESGNGRYDVMLEPRNQEKDNAYIIEFKVYKPEKEKSLEDTVASALAQIEDRHYDKQLIERGIPADRIRKYGFAFRGKEVLIG